MTESERARFLARSLIAIGALSVTFGLVTASLLAPLDEPYTKWRYYARQWGEVFVGSTAYLWAVSCVVLLVLALIPMHVVRKAVSAMPGLNALWLALPLVALWSLAYFIAAPKTQWGFDLGMTGEAEPYLGWPTDVATILSGWIGSIVMGTIVLTVGVFGMRRELQRVRLARVNVCPHCEYSLRGTPDHCPECGWHRNSST